jgi:hypothetical protein
LRAGTTSLLPLGSYPPQIVLKFQHRRKLKDLRVEEFEMGFGEDKRERMVEVGIFGADAFNED